jgi:tetratricopeptide (TPR) repeat protein
LQRARLLRWQGVMVLIDGSKPPWALHPLRLSVALMRERYADEDELLLALVSLPAEACRFGHVEEAISAADELERRTHKRYGTDNIYADTARLLHGQMLLAEGQLAQAVPLLQAAQEGYRRHLGEKNQNVLLSQLELVEVYWRLGQKSESQQLLTAAEQAAARDHAGEPMVARMLKSTQADIAKLQAGQTLHPCGP